MQVNPGRFRSGGQLFAAHNYCRRRLIALGTPGHPTKLIFLSGERINTGACEGASYTDEFSIALKLTFVHPAETTRKNTRSTRSESDRDEVTDNRPRIDTKTERSKFSDQNLASLQTIDIIDAPAITVSFVLWIPKSYDTMASCVVAHRGTSIAHVCLPYEFGMGSWVFKQRVNQFHKLKSPV
ncbi:hypothetical protein PROFUN_09796 [Planoprotostelium fungivorum]|uniref:Uncharacterized protein n=1 Tax=Planoprotostelium fungivorum TaxID=1890364 RepID=A0A2P6NGN9_9EUKA|nr:hypothetical protein PROFUN_09796 [Planoprotostelium fungivorum]